MVKTGICIIVLVFLLNIMACEIRTYDTEQKPYGRRLKIVKYERLYKRIYLPDRKDYSLLTYKTESIISTEAEFENKTLLSQEELYDAANRLNDYGEFGYIITQAPAGIHNRGSSVISIIVEDFNSNILAYIYYDKIYNKYYKEISFDATREQNAEADKMLWFARLLFGNITDDVFASFRKSGSDTEEHKFIYVNDEIIYFTYLGYWTLKGQESVDYELAYSYQPLNRFMEDYRDSIPVKLAELPDYCPCKRYLKVEAYAAKIKLHESGEYYEAVLYDREGHSIRCQIDNIRTGDTYADIKRATTFVGLMWHKDCFEVSCYE